MKRSTAVMFMCVMFALATFAQTSGSTNQDQNPSGSSASSPNTNNGNSGAMSSQSGSMNDNMGQSSDMKGEKTLKGCIQSENGKYMLEEKNGKMAMLKSSEDLSAHVGHEVKVHGMWQNGMSADASAGGGMSNSSGNMSGSMSSDKADHAGKIFMVGKLDMVSDTCKMGMKDHSKMDHQKAPMSEQPQQ